MKPATLIWTVLVAAFLWAEWAKVAQNEYDNTEHRNAESFEQLRGDTIDSNGLGVYPPPTTS